MDTDQELRYSENENENRDFRKSEKRDWTFHTASLPKFNKNVFSPEKSFTFVSVVPALFPVTIYVFWWREKIGYEVQSSFNPKTHEQRLCTSQVRPSLLLTIRYDKHFFLRLTFHYNWSPHTNLPVLVWSKNLTSLWINDLCTRRRQARVIWELCFVVLIARRQNSLSLQFALRVFKYVVVLTCYLFQTEIMFR